MSAPWQAAGTRVVRAVVVDDDERLLGVIKRGLRLHGFEVTTFATLTKR
jgi:DNA-binding response OmpR family regulator